MSKQPLSKSQANLCGVSFGISDSHAENGKLSVGRINDRESQISRRLSESVCVAGLLWRGQLVIEEECPVLVNKVKRILVARAETKKRFGVAILLLQLREPLREACERAGFSNP